MHRVMITSPQASARKGQLRCDTGSAINFQRLYGTGGLPSDEVK
jgi:hypothetical protein